MLTELPSNWMEESARTKTMEPSALMLATESGRVATVSPTNRAEERSTLLAPVEDSLSLTVKMAELAANRTVGTNSNMAARNGVLTKKRKLHVQLEIRCSHDSEVERGGTITYEVTNECSGRKAHGRFGEAIRVDMGAGGWAPHRDRPDWR